MKNVKNKRTGTASLSVKVTFPIGVKLALIIGLVVLVSLGSVTFLSSYLMGQDVQITAENANLSVNEKAAGTVQDKFSSVRANVFQLLDLVGVVSGGRSGDASQQAISLFLKRNSDIAVIYVLSADSIANPNPSDDKIVNQQFFARNEINISAVDNFLYTRQDELIRSCNGETIALNASPFFKMPACALLFPYRENGREQSCVIIFSIENLSDILGSGSVNTTFLINDSDEILFHPDVERTIAGESFVNFPLVKAMRENNQNNETSRQIPFVVKETAAENGFAASAIETKVRQFGMYIKNKAADVFAFISRKIQNLNKCSENGQDISIADTNDETGNKAAASAIEIKARQFCAYIKNRIADIAAFICGKLQKSQESSGKTQDVLLVNEKTGTENEAAASAIEKDVSYFGAYQKTNIADIVVLTTVSQDIVLEGVRKTLRDNIYLTLVIFFLSIILILFFARYAISVHLRRLTAAAMEIQQGNFGTEIISELNAKRHDEIGVLNESVKNEQEFLETFARFTNKGVAKAIARKEIDFDPHLKDITIFFSDIRGFTAISDGFKNKFGNESPREIIGFLNDYMGRMVECISLSGGNVDKFEGDAIMAVWGILRDEDLSFEQLPDSNPEKEQRAALHAQHVKEDALNAIRGTIAMRYALMKYNKDAEAFTKAHEGDGISAQYKPHIQIGCGLNTGRATAGIMGGKDKMEYTAIGDAVNFASRTESSNKPCGTDILITEDTVAVLQEEINSGEIIVEQIPVAFEVKGKGTQHFYGVVNMPNFDITAFFRAGNPGFVPDKDCMRACGKNGPHTLNEVRLMLGIPIPEFEKVNLNEEENKIQVKQ